MRNRYKGNRRYDYNNNTNTISLLSNYLVLLLLGLITEAKKNPPEDISPPVPIPYEMRVSLYS